MSGPEGRLPEGYEFVRPLGAGGFGEVVLARHRILGRLVAVKRIHEHALSDPEAIERFRREARVLSTTSCPSIVRVYDLHTGEDGAHLVMEYCPGRSLAELLEQGPLPAREALQVLTDVADALGVMAERGIVHRDVKPGNVFVLPDGHAKLGDFGLARALADPSIFRTAAGAAMGTPAYFPPEVSQGIAEPDARSDAYSFAILAYEVLTGRRPFEAEDALSLITAHWSQEPVPAPTVMPGFPEAAWRILGRGMDKDPASRPLPRELVGGLALIDPSTWPAVTRSDERPAPRRSDPTVHQPGFRPPRAPDKGAGAVAGRRPRPRSRARRRLTVVGGVTIGTLLVALGGWWALPKDQEITVTSMRVEVEPGSGAGTCPRERFVLTGVLATNGSAGTVMVQWALPDGARTPTRSIKVERGQREVRVELPFTVRGSEPLVGVAEIRVLGPEGSSASRPIRYECPRPRATS